jgi:death-on-curing protein
LGNEAEQSVVPIDGSARVIPVSNAGLPPLQWRIVANTPIRRYLTEEDVLAIHEALTEDFQEDSDPIYPPGVRDRNLLSSAVHRPYASWGDHQKYPTAEMAGAALFHSLVQNHAFHNGNKRTALVSMAAFLDDNGLVLTCRKEDIFRFTLNVAKHAIVATGADTLADREMQEIAGWIRQHARKAPRQDRTLRWHKLRGRLSEFGCTLTVPGGIGHRINIERTVQNRVRFGRTRTEVLRTQVAWEGDASECDRMTIRKIRGDLQLDDDHVDSSHFYEGAKVDSFIIEYRGILRRLARL